MANKKKRSKPIPLLAVFLAWLIPGAGHVYIGRTVRGVVVFAVIAALFWAGVLVGGALTVDHYTESWWMMAQMCTGVHGLIGWQQQRQLYARLEQETDIGPLNPPAAGEITNQQVRVDEVFSRWGVALVNPADTVARAYSGTAGLLNLLCMFDALMLALMGKVGEPARRETNDAPGDGKESDG